MLRIPSSLDSQVFGADRSGRGFAWWYVDLVDAERNGLVLVWAYQLPFIAALNDTSSPSRPSPSLSLGLYRDNREVFYLLRQFDIDAVAWEKHTGSQVWRWGRTEIALDSSQPKWRLTVKLDTQVPGERERLGGFVRLEGPARSGGEGEFGSSEHIWSPMLLGATASGKIHLGPETLWESRQARGYFDRNAGRHTLERSGIRRWWWMRIALSDRDLILYDVESDEGKRHSVSLCVDADGAASVCPSPDVLYSRPRRSFWGPRWFRSISFTSPGGNEARVEARELVESGPFYLRYLVDARDTAGRLGIGVGEVVDVARLARRWHRPLVRMRRHLARGRNSIWLPLFIGRRRGRWTRLLRYWLDLLFARPKRLETGPR